MEISVVIPLYNHEKYLEGTVLSVLEQSVPAREIVIIDDGSGDSSLEKARELSDRFPGRIRVYSQSNRGAHNAINRGILLAKGDLIAVLNSDDQFAGTKVDECLRLFRDDGELDALATGIAFIDGDGNGIPHVPWYENAVTYYRDTGNLMLGLLNANFFMTTSNFVFRREIVRDVGLFADLRYAHDYDFFLRLLATRCKIAFHDRPLVTYRMHATNTIRENLNKVLTETVFVLAVFLRYLTITGNDIALDRGKARQLLQQKQYSEPISEIFNHWDARKTPFSSWYTALEDKPLYDLLYGYFDKRDIRG